MFIPSRKISSVLIGAVIWCLFGSTVFASPPDTAASLANLEQSEGIKVSYALHPVTGALRMLKSRDGKPVFRNAHSVATPEAAARNFVSRHGKMFGIGSDKEHLTRKISRDKKGNSFVRFQQQQLGLPVIAAEFVIHTDPSGNVMSMLGKTSLQPLINTTPSVSASDCPQHRASDYRKNSSGRCCKA